METHWVRPQLALALALGCALAAAGGLVSVVAPVTGLVIAAIGAVSVLVDVAGRTGPLRMLLPKRATQVVLVAPAEGATVDLLAVARTDVPRQGPARRLARVRGGLWWLVLCALVVVAAAAARAAGTEGTLLGAIQLIPTVVLLVAAAVALDAIAAQVGDGRVEDAALAAALTLHDDSCATRRPASPPACCLRAPTRCARTCGASASIPRARRCCTCGPVTCAAAILSGSQPLRRPGCPLTVAARVGCRRRSRRPSTPRR